jgi:hypothetical protein
MTCWNLHLLAWAAALSLGFGTASAAEARRWCIQVFDDHAIVRAQANANIRYVQATVNALGDVGIDRIVLRRWESEDKIEDAAVTYYLTANKDVAQIESADDLPQKHREAIARRLKECGIDDVQYVRSEQPGTKD